MNEEADRMVKDALGIKKSNRELIDNYDYKFTNETFETWYIKQKDKDTYLITGDDVDFEIKEMSLHSKPLLGTEVHIMPFIMRQSEKQWLLSCIEKMNKKVID